MILVKRISRIHGHKNVMEKENRERLLGLLVLFVGEIRTTRRNPEVHYLNRLNVSLILDRFYQVLML